VPGRRPGTTSDDAWNRTSKSASSASISNRFGISDASVNPPVNKATLGIRLSISRSDQGRSSASFITFSLAANKKSQVLRCRQKVERDIVYIVYMYANNH